MSIMKDFFIEEIEKIYSEYEESGQAMDENKMADLANQRAIDRFAGMCDAAKDRAKYQD